jgi:hypothetical protein
MQNMTVFTVCRKYAKYDQYKTDMHDMHNTQIFKENVKTLQNMQYYAQYVIDPICKLCQ